MVLKGLVLEPFPADDGQQDGKYRSGETKQLVKNSGAVSAIRSIIVDSANPEFF